MRQAIGLLTSLAMMLPGAASANPQSFDGAWLTRVSCAAARDALGYAFEFVSTVKGGVLHGERGSPGEASSLQIDGKIATDGSATLFANGRTGSKEFVPGRDTPRGSPYSYSVDARFTGSMGTGARVEGRPCIFHFDKQ